MSGEQEPAPLDSRRSRKLEEPSRRTRVGKMKKMLQEKGLRENMMEARMNSSMEPHHQRRKDLPEVLQMKITRNRSNAETSRENGHSEDKSQVRDFNLRKQERKSYIEGFEHKEDDYLFCEKCQLYFVEKCSVHGPPIFIKDSAAEKYQENRSVVTLPPGLQIKTSGIPNAGLGVWNQGTTLSRGLHFGPYMGIRTNNERESYSGYSWMIVRGKNYYEYLDGKNTSFSNWMRYVNCARTEEEQNLMAIQFHGEIYYRTCRVIPPGQELLVWYGEEYARNLGILSYNKNPEPGERPHSSGGSFAPSARGGGVKQRIWSKCRSAALQRTRERRNSTHDFPPKHEDTAARQDERQCPDRGRAKQRGVRKSEQIERAKAMGRKKTLGALSPQRREGLSDEAGQRKKSGHEKSGHEQLRQKPGPSEAWAGPAEGSAIPRRHCCDVCGKAFNRLSRLKLHKRIHTGEKPLACRYCKRAFSDPSNLKRHLRIHTEVKPYECKICGKAFGDPSNLKRHAFSHTGEKPFACPDCGRRFSRKDHLNEHRAKHAEDNIIPNTRGTGNLSATVVEKSFWCVSTKNYQIHKEVTIYMRK